MNRSLQDSLITVIAGMGMLLSTLDTGIINVALSFLTGEFQTTTNIASFTITGYTLALASSILPLGVLSDKFGKLKISYLGFVLFGLSSLFCGFANSVEWLIIGRIIQGIGAAALQATSAALITTLVSEESQNSSISILGVMIGLGPVLGPSLGGILLSLNLWRFIFWLNVPFAILAIICNHYLLNKVSEETSKRTLDTLGTVVNATALVCLLLGLSLLSKSNLLVVSLILIISGLFLGIIFYHVEFRNKQALVDVEGLKNNPQVISYFFQTVAFGFASAMIFLLPPFIFEQLYHLGVGQTGFLVLGAPAGLVIFSRLSGKYNDGSKNKAFSHLGLGIIIVSLLFLLFLTPNWPYFFLTLGLFIYGIGGGYFQPANIASIMQASPMEMQGSTGALQRMVQNVAISAGSAVGSTCLNLWSNNLLLATRIGWGITLVLVIMSLKNIIFSKHNN
ncbi:MFS transporter [Streptococcus caviae]|uniref:MFS transporter n=1 Tax=Streptococcus sp. 'caviae' TaxID=1915004 RepID=UPI00094B9605|nr:MFS transporter [Streptococcus sp. 'caviae']OLN82315.1 MFS transporter [Streptococcus sp. 'caviae']